MASLKQIKTKIRSVQKTGTVTKAMEAVSAAKMLARALGARELYFHPLVFRRPVSRELYIAITSDKGLAGSLNSGVLRAVLAEASNSNASIIAIGRKASDFFAGRGFVVEAFHPNTDEISAELVQEIVTEVSNRFVSGAVDSVKIVYQNFISTFEQRPAVRTIFPLSLVELEKVVAGIAPAKGAFSRSEKGIAFRAVRSYTVEPGEREVLDAILPRLAGIFVYHALLESQASEHSARMVAMKSASDKSEEMAHSLTLKFNKARQSAITREVSEIISGTI
ncbi:MAG: ATP synthase F1 subcomplex gamma subunit [Candidatus Adlerbacteria bacterium GW2011_GWB1_54_7]|uniref:ATP synthase F1 subcomplex gamma subunit n=1 Tax=Candidatus Adlerbacteria bacterium GW2011_GWB1_54_7 TaxID=1618607 RepID=A0A0G2AYF4_9BACT|nr:MAG: ATP synthase F1 subcomplex gamma subunit [Candidatus Adlerbacteria bacterium GW2011_GWB1_54_7]